MIGNPPFAGKNSLINSNRDGYLDWLKTIHAESHGNSDLVAHFFRRAFALIRSDGCLGLIATNTIGQGDTRSTGLRYICNHGGTIFYVQKRLRWPGRAAVVVSVVVVSKGSLNPPYCIDGRPANQITAFLFHRGGNDDPARLIANSSKAFIGFGIYGTGFTFDDSKAEATPLDVMHDLISTNPKNADHIHPYLGGDEFILSPTQQHRRYVINFEDMTETEARRWPDLMSIVEERVRPERASLPHKNATNIKRSTLWWQFGAYPKRLAKLIRGHERVLFHPNLFIRLTFGFVPARTVVAAPHNVLLYDSLSAFCVLQASSHEIWAQFFASSLGDQRRYAPTDCFETFPLPRDFEGDSRLEAAGKAYYDFRAALMVRNDEGLTKTYNRFHDPHEKSADILKLRELHDAMDRAVLDAYGWTDLQPTCEFLLDYEEEEDELEPGKKPRKKKRPWRYRWPDDFRDEVLARLLDLNAKRAEQERLSGAAAAAKGIVNPKPTKSRAVKSDSEAGLFDDQEK